ncbi:DMT family transporter [Cupriavidus basilensis]|uniref:DMT family transporter n=1 Tax=Cupriavidus basilensis TaxID=68895 RepID=UPI00157AC57E|nr:DMT family transporter [Cupriavidus basilensis]NUA31416.1 DMT family transporter [Cupriavidus basilensis]
MTGPANPSLRLTTASARRDGILLFFCALVAFASYDAFCKWMLRDHSAPMMNLTRYVSVSVIALVWLLREGDLKLWRTPCKWLLLSRGLALGIVASCFMAALVHMPLAEATAIYFTAPLIMVALSPAVLGERVGRAQWAAVLAGFGGMLLIVRPGGDLPVAGTVLMIVSAVCYAAFQLLTRRLAGVVAGPVLYAWTALICLAVTGVPALATLPEVMPPAPDILLMMAGGACSGLAQLLLLAAFRRVAASTLAPLNYFQLLLAVLISTFVFQRPPDGIALAGIVLIMLSGGYLALRGRQAPPAPPAPLVKPVAARPKD